MIFKTTTSTDRTVFQAVVDAALEHAPNHVALEDPVSGKMTYKRALIGARVLGKKLAPLAPRGRDAHRPDAADLDRSLPSRSSA